MPDENSSPTFWQRFPPGVVGFTLLYLVAAGVGVLSTGNREFLFYIAVMLVLIAVICAVHVKVNLSRGLLWALSVWGLLHMAGGLVPVPPSWPISGEIRVLYSWWVIPETLKYDHIVHAYGFAVATFLVWEGLRSSARHQTQSELAPTAGIALICAFASMGLGAFNEVVEFAATLMLPETNVGGYINTGWDLVANMTGAFAAAAFIYFGKRRGN